MTTVTSTPRRRTFVAYQVAGAATALALWSGLTYTGLVNPFIIPTPTAVAAALYDGWLHGDLASHVFTTVRAFATGLSIAIVAGIGLGVLPGLMPRLHRSVEPLIGLALSIPIVTYFAAMIVLFGYGFTSVIALSVVTATPPMLVSTVTAFQEVDKALVRVGHIYCAGRLALFRRVLLPGALATLASGVRIAGGRALIGVIVGEMFLSSRGLGAQIITASGFFDIPAYFAVVVSLAVISYGIALLFSWIENRMMLFDG